MTSDAANLFKTVVANPSEDTPALVFADALDEAHPAGRDGRADILRHAVAGGQHHPQTAFVSGYPIHYEQHHNLRMTTTTEVGQTDPVFGLILRQGKFEDPDYRIHVIHAEVPHADAREVADHLPNSAEVHKFLDTHFGPDPRTSKYTRDFIAALRDRDKTSD